VSCTYWSKNLHVISGRLSYRLLCVSFDLCLVAVWWAYFIASLIAVIFARNEVFMAVKTQVERLLGL
jgi:hypothetical protein